MARDLKKKQVNALSSALKPLDQKPKKKFESLKMIKTKKGRDTLLIIKIIIYKNYNFNA